MHHTLHDARPIEAADLPLEPGPEYRPNQQREGHTLVSI